MAIWAVIQFSVWPVKASSKVGGIFENLIRSLVFYSLLLRSVLSSTAFAHKKDFNQLNFLWFFIPAVLIFLSRHWLLSINIKKPTPHKQIKTEDLKKRKL